MNESIFLTSFFSNQRSGSKSLTSAAILVENCVVSNRVIVSTPLRPSQRAFHVSSVPVPSAVTNPTPVTTTLLFSNLEPHNLLPAAPFRACAASSRLVTGCALSGLRGFQPLRFGKVTLDIANGILH